MKKFLLFTIGLILILLLGCTKDINGKDTSTILPNENDSLIEDADNDKNDNQNSEKDNSNEKDKKTTELSFKDEAIKLNLKFNPYVDNWELIRQEWTKKLLDSIYKDVDIKDLKTEVISIGRKEILSDLELVIDEIYVQFSCDEELKGVKVNEYGEYSTKVYMFYLNVVKEGETYYLLDAVNDTYNTYKKEEIFKYAVEVLDNDDRFTKNIDIARMFDKEISLPDNVCLFEKYKLLDGYEIENVYKEDEKLILLLKKAAGIYNNGNLLHNIRLCSYDYYSNELNEILKAENIDGYSFRYENKLVLYSDGERTHSINLDGDISLADDLDKKIKYMYSPDKKYCAYSDEERNLIVRNEETQEIIIKLKSVSYEEELKSVGDYKSYIGYAWFDNENFIYSMGGWEWSNGVGIVNVTALEDIVLEDSRFKWIDKLEENKLTVKYNPYGDISPFTVGYYYLDKKPYVYQEGFNSDKYPELTENLNDYIFSKDMNYIYTFEGDYKKYQYIVKVFSVAEEKFIKEIKIDTYKHSQYHHISRTMSFDDKLLLIYNDDDLYFIELTDN